jgi:hypothetical protein
VLVKLENTSWWWYRETAKKKKEGSTIGKEKK